MQHLLISGLTAVALLLVPVLSAAAQSSACPVVDESVVSTALSETVHGGGQMTTGVELCDFTDDLGTGFGVGRERNAFGAGEGGAAALATRYIPQLPDLARTQIDTLSALGINVAVPGYELSAVNGVGDAALWVKTELTPGTFIDSLLVQVGPDGFTFNTDDSPDAQMKLTALARAVLANLNP